MINIIIGTETGTAEFVADEVIELLENNNIEAQASLEPDLTTLLNYDRWIVITSTHGAGDLPSNLQPLYQQIQQSKPDLSSKKAMVIALGDSSYDTYCQAGKTIYELLEQHKIDLITPLFKVDAMDEDLPEDLVIEWLTPLLARFN